MEVDVFWLVEGWEEEGGDLVENEASLACAEVSAGALAKADQ